ncbi:rRNA biogenesis protein rrp5 [Desulfosporosinus sp. Tol-M]|nr:rRNA biogenesis protein rrp5 [Desulfosporosinus sp. Tol-M]
MSKIKLLLDLVEDIRSLADSLQALCDKAVQGEPDSGQTQPVESETPEPSNISLEQVRTVLTDKSRNGLTAEVRELIRKYGADKLSEIKPEHFSAVLKEAEVLGNG